MNKAKYRVAIVDEHEDIRALLYNLLISAGYEVETFSHATEMIHIISGKKHSELDHKIDLIISDINMPDINELILKTNVKEYYPDTPVILISEPSESRIEEEAKKRGAFEYIIKPFQPKNFLLKVQEALGLAKSTNIFGVEVNCNPGLISGMIGKSAAMKEIFEFIQKVADMESTVLITGESGTGKEMVARAIHQNSERAKNQFVAINCAAIPDSLLESELFGHAKGSFTGAVQRKRGLFEEAEGGTLFLDEIGDLNLLLQTKLLRALQEKKVRAVGENNDKRINVRIIAATHKNLKEALKHRTFREDLFYRLNVIPINIPPLRERKEDIPLLVEYFLKRQLANKKISAKGITDRAVRKLMTLKWEGNIRELENVIERTVVLANAKLIDEEHLSLLGSDLTTNAIDALEGAMKDSITLQELERRYIKWALVKTQNHKDKAAQLLGICRRTLYRKEREYGFLDDELQPVRDEKESCADEMAINSYQDH